MQLLRLGRNIVEFECRIMLTSAPYFSDPANNVLVKASRHSSRHTLLGNQCTHTVITAVVSAVGNLIRGSSQWKLISVLLVRTSKVAKRLAQIFPTLDLSIFVSEIPKRFEGL